MAAETPVWTDTDVIDMTLYLLGKIRIEWGQFEPDKMSEDILKIIAGIAHNKESSQYRDPHLCESLCCPKDDALLYINSPYPWVRHIAAWRLQEGK